MDIALRRMRWWDIESLIPVERALFPDEPWSAETFWSELAGVPVSRHYLIAECQDQLAGYAGLMVAGYTSDVQTMAVAPEFRRAGVGRRRGRRSSGAIGRRFVGQAVDRDDHAGDVVPGVVVQGHPDQLPGDRLRVVAVAEQAGEGVVGDDPGQAVGGQQEREILVPTGRVRTRGGVGS